MDLPEIRNAVERLRTQLSRVVVGQENVVSLVLIALLSEGHVLIEGVPGTAKTLPRPGKSIRSVWLSAQAAKVSSRRMAVDQLQAVSCATS